MNVAFLFEFCAVDCIKLDTVLQFSYTVAVKVECVYKQLCISMHWQVEVFEQSCVNMQFELNELNLWPLIHNETCYLY